MLEVQDAANVITEAIDPDAKVIFGAVTDDTLKKGQVRVTVIATGFPESTTRTPNILGQRLAPRKDEIPVIPARPVEKPAAKKVEIPAEKHDAREVPKMPERPAATTPGAIGGNDDEDSWGGLPSFLRRK